MVVAQEHGPKRTAKNKRQLGPACVQGVVDWSRLTAIRNNLFAEREQFTGNQ